MCVCVYSSSLVNIVLDGYSRATDSLLDAIGSSQTRSLMYLSLKSCTFLTDAGFSNIARLEELEFLDLSHCRITDKTLAFTLSKKKMHIFDDGFFRLWNLTKTSMELARYLLDLPNLTTLHLASTKITSGGLAKIVADAAWRDTLQALDISCCKGISGKSVLSTLQGICSNSDRSQ